MSANVKVRKAGTFERMEKIIVKGRHVTCKDCEYLYYYYSGQMACPKCGSLSFEEREQQ